MTDRPATPTLQTGDRPTRTVSATRRRFRLAERIGTGATATVWRARDTLTGRDVAVKCFHPHLLADPLGRRRIEAEATAAARVVHPAIVSAVETISDQDGLALVFPFVEGATLATRLANGPPLGARDAAAIAGAIADALAVAHEAGVIHRDVKPANILLGADGQARLLDFGISRSVVDTPGDGGQLTGAGLAIGTLPYMAPEQLAAEPPTPATDVYALGVVLYEMLAGRRPFAAASAVNLAREQALAPPRIDGAPRALVDLALAALASDASARPTAAQFARALRGFLDGRTVADEQTVAVAAVAAAAVGPASTRRSPAPFLLAALGALLVAAVLAFSSIGLPGGPGPSLAPEPNQFGSVPMTPPATPPSTPDPSPTAALGHEPPSAGGSGDGSGDGHGPKRDKPKHDDKGKHKGRGGRG